MKKFVFGLIMISAFAILNVQTSQATVVSFCSHGSLGKCVVGGSGFDCRPGGSECGGTHLEQL